MLGSRGSSSAHSKEKTISLNRYDLVDGPIGCDLEALDDVSLLEVRDASVGTGDDAGPLNVCHSPRTDTYIEATIWCISRV
jgi:hypothetical protein